MQRPVLGTGHGARAACIALAPPLPPWCPDEDAPEISDDCQEEVYQYKITRNSNINRNVPLGACMRPVRGSPHLQPGARGAAAPREEAGGRCYSWAGHQHRGTCCACPALYCQASGPWLLPRPTSPPSSTLPRAAKACKVDADKFCNVTWFFGYKAGQVVSCLRDVKSQVSKNCKSQLFKIMLEVSGKRSFRLRGGVHWKGKG